MAKIELGQEIVVTKKQNKKRKHKDAHNDQYDGADGRSGETESPTSKFKKLDISQICKTAKATKQPINGSAPAHQTNGSPAIASASGFAAVGEKKNNKRKQAPVRMPPVDAKKHKADSDADDDDDEPQEPSVAELAAAERPENIPQIETTRQKKRDKHIKVQETAKLSSAQRELLRNREYLEQWRDDRSAWKFNKLRQISVTKTLFSDTEPMDDALWQTALDYLCATKGQLRQLLRDSAQKVIDAIDARIDGDPSAAGELVKSLNYTRARTFLQMME